MLKRRRMLIVVGVVGVCVASALAVVHQTSQPAEGVVWGEGRGLGVGGVGWEELAGTFERLPGSAKGKVKDQAWDLSKHSAGIAVRFVTDAPRVIVRWSLARSALEMP